MQTRVAKKEREYTPEQLSGWLLEVAALKKLQQEEAQMKTTRDQAIPDLRRQIGAGEGKLDRARASAEQVRTVPHLQVLRMLKSDSLYLSRLCRATTQSLRSKARPKRFKP